MSIDNLFDKMAFRLNKRGGEEQINRMNEDKLKSLESAIKYSYQSAKIGITFAGEEEIFVDGLINPDKLSLDLDNKILSIPFEAGIQEGDVIAWHQREEKEEPSYWLVYLQHLEETAYFRASLRRCRHQVELNGGRKYWVYIRGPVEQSVIWQQTQGNYVNKLNNTLVMYITKDAVTDNYFHRFAKVKIEGNTWEVQAVDRLSTPGILEVALKEDFNNDYEDAETQVQDLNTNSMIQGPAEVYPYETVTYTVKNEGEWAVVSSKAKIKIVEKTGTSIKLFIASGKSGNFTVSHSIPGEAIAAVATITIKSL